MVIHLSWLEKLNRVGLQAKDEMGSSDSVMFGYGLDDQPIEVRSLAEAKDFSSSLCVQTGSGAHPASCPMSTMGPFPGGKAQPGRDADHSPHKVPTSRMSRSYTSSPPSAFMACSGKALAFGFFLLKPKGAWIAHSV
jgi:hypothetical protein